MRMKLTFNIVSFLTKMKYEDHDLLAYTKCKIAPFEVKTGKERDPMVHTPQKWVMGLQRSRILGLIHMPHFGRLVEANACDKKLLACFYGGYLWLDQLVPVIVELISQVTGFPMQGPDPLQ